MHTNLAQLISLVHPVTSVIDPHLVESPADGVRGAKKSGSSSCARCSSTVRLGGVVRHDAFHLLSCVAESVDYVEVAIRDLEDVHLGSCCISTCDDLIGAITDSQLQASVVAHRALCAVVQEEGRVKAFEEQLREESTVADHSLVATFGILQVAQHAENLEREAIAAGYTLGHLATPLAALLVDAALEAIHRDRMSCLHHPVTRSALRQEVIDLYGVDDDDTMVICGINRRRRSIAGDVAARSTILDAIMLVYGDGDIDKQVISIPRWAHHALRLLGGRGCASLAYSVEDGEPLETATTLWLEATIEDLDDFDRCMNAARQL